MPTKKKRTFDVITIFPETVDSYTNASILGRAQKIGLVQIKAHDLRDWTADKHHKVDDTPYGGGPGMVMRVEPFEKAVREIKAERATEAGKGKKVRVILTSASGQVFTQKDAKRLAKYDHLIFLCGRYEGVDARVAKYVADEELSIGEYVLTGGELPALVMLDAIARLVRGVIEKESLARESYDKEGYREHPQYTKPAVYCPPPARGGVRGGGRNSSLEKWCVPEVLLSGDHKKIEEWRKLHQRFSE